MPNLNKVMLMGNLTRDPELRYTNSNQAVCNIGLAVNRQWTNRQTNERQQETTYVDCEAWGKPGETINQYLKKGNPVYLEGRLKLDQWQDKDGGNRSKLKIVIENFQFLSSGGQGGGQGGQNQNYGGAPAGGPPAQGGGFDAAPNSYDNNSQMAAPHDPIPESDIPF